jgi:hypothetical protein
MSWLEDLASTLGVPTGATALALTMYGACAAAEKAARPTALQEIGRALTDSSWEHSVRPAAIIGQVFGWTFGEKHLSWKCVYRSAMATTAFIAATTITIYLVTGYFIYRNFTFSYIYIAIQDAFVAYIADYIALWKTRILIKYATHRIPSVAVLAADILLSVIISCGMFMISYQVAAILGNAIYGDMEDTFDSSIRILRNNGAIFLSGKMPQSWYAPILVSTLLTSLWTALILLSITVLKLISPIHRFTAWLFEVEKHPLQAIGIVASVVVMIFSLVWTVLHSLI